MLVAALAMEDKAAGVRSKACSRLIVDKSWIGEKPPAAMLGCTIRSPARAQGWVIWQLEANKAESGRGEGKKKKERKKNPTQQPSDHRRSFKHRPTLYILDGKSTRLISNGGSVAAFTAALFGTVYTAPHCGPMRSGEFSEESVFVSVE